MRKLLIALVISCLVITSNAAYLAYPQKAEAFFGGFDGSATLWQQLVQIQQLAAQIKLMVNQYTELKNIWDTSREVLGAGIKGILGEYGIGILSPTLQKFMANTGLDDLLQDALGGKVGLAGILQGAFSGIISAEETQAILLDQYGIKIPAGVQKILRDKGYLNPEKLVQLAAGTLGRSGCAVPQKSGPNYTGMASVTECVTRCNNDPGVTDRNACAEQCTRNQDQQGDTINWDGPRVEPENTVMGLWDGIDIGDMPGSDLFNKLKLPKLESCKVDPTMLDQMQWVLRNKYNIGLDRDKIEEMAQLGLLDTDLAMEYVPEAKPKPIVEVPKSGSCVREAGGQCVSVGTSLTKVGAGSVNIPTDTNQFVMRIFTFILAAAGGVALILILIAGYKYIVSSGKPEVLQDAKDQLTAAIVGLIFIIFSFVIFQLIIVDILRIPGVTGGPGSG